MAACRELGNADETITKSSEGDLVRVKYTFRYGDKFNEPNDDWLKCIEATSDELLGAYSKAEDNVLSAAFGGRGKKRMNRVFDAIGFVYPDYRYPLRGQGKKRKDTALAAPAEPVPKAAGKKMKVLTHRSRTLNRLWCLSLAGRPLQLLNQEKLFLPCRGLKSQQQCRRHLRLSQLKRRLTKIRLKGQKLKK
jgi:hypothetical protein